MKIHTFYTCLLALLTCSCLPAQPLWKLRNTDIRVKGIVPPLTPLPEHLKTYGVVSRSDMDLRTFILDENSVQSAFALEAFEKKNEQPDFSIRVKFQAFHRSENLKTRKDTSKQVYYWYETSVRPDMELRVTDREGKLYFTQDGGLTSTYKTPERKTEREAQADFNRRLYDPAYNGIIAEAHHKTLQHWAGLLRNQYDDQSETISLYAPNVKTDDPIFTQHLKAIASALQHLHRDRSLAEVKTALAPDLAYLEQEMSTLNPDSKKTKWRYFACGLTLANVYRCIDDYDNARRALRGLIAADYYAAQPVATHIANMKARYDATAYYRKTGNTWSAEREKQTRRHLDTLLNQSELDGYIVLRNGKKVQGTLLDFLENYKAQKVKLRYEKKLNAPIADPEYAVADVREIHSGDWHLMNITYLSRFCLAEVVYESPAVTLCRTLPGFGIKSAYSKQVTDLNFLKLAGETDFSPLYDSQMKGLSRYLKDCPAIARQVKYGYYAEGAVLEAIQDYDWQCGAGLADTTGKAAPQTTKTKRLSAQSPGFYVGFSTGLNNFTSLGGLNVTFRVSGKTFVRTGIGYGFWGAKFAAGLQYNLRRDMRYKQGWSFALGYAHSWGAGTPLTLGTSSSSGNGATQETETILEEHPVNTVHLSTLFHKFAGKKSAFFAEIGYSLSLQKDPWTIVSGNAKNARSSIKFVQPGGLILAVGVNFGL